MSRNYVHVGREIDPGTMTWVYAVRTNVGETLTGAEHNLYLRFHTKTVTHGTHWIAVDPAMGATSPVGDPLARSLDTHVIDWERAREEDAQWKEFLTDILVTAAEGGINYWADVEQYEADGTDPFLKVSEDNSEEAGAQCYGFGLPTQARPCDGHLVSLDVIEKGIAMCRVVSPENYKSHLIQRAVWEIDSGDIDASGADIIVQFGLFGEIVYG